ncbi:MAG: DUF262 domain-containing protein [Dehalococcoidia bacterium]
MGSQMTIAELLSAIRNKDLILPEFQRGYVWSRDQVKGYLDSLYRGYPTGSFLIWKTPNPGVIRGATPDSVNAFQLILDGQQRLTSVHALLRGEPPPFYEGEELYFNLYFNVRTEEFSYYKKTQMQGQIEWLPVTPFFLKGLGDYLGPAGGLSEEQRAFLWEYLPRLAQLDKVRNYTYYLDVLTEQDMETAVRIFNLVNSRGTRLSKADLVLSHICALWPQARATFREAADELANAGYNFDLGLIVRTLAAVATGSGRLEPVYALDAAAIQEAWQRTRKSLNHLVNVLKSDAFMPSAGSLTSHNVVIPMVCYLASNGCAFRSDREKRAFLHWMYAALMWGRYSGPTETRLTQDIQALSQPEPTRQLLENIIADRGRIKVQPSDLVNANSGSAWFAMAHVVALSRSARDWTTGLPIHGKLIGRENAVEYHHIFPQGLLKAPKGPYDTSKPAGKQRVNEMANLAFLTLKGNREITNSSPNVYLPKVETRFPGALGAQDVPTNAALWALDRYEDFLMERRARLAASINSFMEALLEKDAPKPVTIADYIHRGEDEELEFKSSLRWDYIREKENLVLSKTVARTLAGFMNAKGGTLIIGVTDSGDVLGIEPDYATLDKRPDRDGWEQALVQVLINYLGKDFAALVENSFADVDGKTVAVIRADPTVRPAFLAEANNATEFYVRTGNTTQLLNAKEANHYIDEHFGLVYA